jgi:predicted Zn-dependent protease
MASWRSLAQGWRRRCARVAAAVTAGIALALSLASQAEAQNLIRDSEIEATLREYTDPILLAANLEPRDVRLRLINDHRPNAFVARGQQIFFHTGIITTARTPNELIGVIAHETGHIAGGHLARSRQAMQDAAIPAYIAMGVGILAIAAGQPEAGINLLAGAPAFAQGDFVRHTQTQESSADQAALNYLEATGQSGLGLLTYFDREFRPNEFMTRRLPPYMLTHPFTSDRVEALRQQVEASPFRDAVDSPERIFQFDMIKAKIIGFLRPVDETFSLYPASDTSLPARYARAIAHYRQANLARAEAEIGALIAEQPDNPYFQELMGQMFFESGRSAQAIPFHRRSLELRPEDALLQVNLARALIGLGRRENLEEAVALLTAATHIEPENALAWREMSAAYDGLDNEGMALLAAAEQHYVGGNLPLAQNFAQRARTDLTPQTVAWRRADDILRFSEIRIEEISQRRN